MSHKRSFTRLNGRSPYVRGGLYYGGFFGMIGLYLPFVNLYFDRIGLTGSQIGWLSIVTPLFMLTITMPISALADKLGQRKRFLQIGLLGFAISLFFVQFPRSFWGIFLMIGLFSLFLSPTLSLANGLIARMASNHHLNYGSMRLWGSVAFAILSLLFGWLYQQWSLSLIFVIAPLATLLVIGLVQGLEEEPVQHRPDQSAKRPSLLTIIREANLWGLLLPWFFVMVGFGIVLTFEGVAMSQLGGGEFLVGLTLAVAAVSELPSMQYGEKMQRRLGEWGLLLLGTVSLTLAYIGLSLFAVPTIFPLMAILRGFGFGIFVPTIVRLIDSRVPIAWSATAQALIIITNAIANIIGNPLGGLLFERFGAQQTFMACALSLLVATLLVIRSWVAERHPQAQPSVSD